MKSTLRLSSKMTLSFSFCPYLFGLWILCVMCFVPSSMGLIKKKPDPIHQIWIHLFRPKWILVLNGSERKSAGINHSGSSAWLARSHHAMRLNIITLAGPPVLLVYFSEKQCIRPGADVRAHKPCKMNLSVWSSQSRVHRLSAPPQFLKQTGLLLFSKLCQEKRLYPLFCLITFVLSSL